MAVAGLSKKKRSLFFAGSPGPVEKERIGDPAGLNNIG